ncbi:hypothetical protein H696_04261 [Fonticula alba]|uniref:Biogenesis of lysosome-related organelles complex 1 subunit 1 n=1 Tax=Fonticula alba TaxID=691883 RepID=A0A058Z4J0_FONAL|nr:hypothetical protein H696_04261 [Fonticula alba]KCV68843.1 hypothetical protein H696_04261 [Fonticula alba]|eukprot:XP_009496414.1 hypothetical protein H696_04261 [Fonticula alba]
MSANPAAVASPGRPGAAPAAGAAPARPPPPALQPLMLNQTLRQYQNQQSATRAETDNLRRQMSSSVRNFSDLSVDLLNERVMMVFDYQQAIEQEANQLQQASARFAKQSAQWLSLVESFNTALKELGDVNTWAQTIEHDMTGIAAALEYVYKGSIEIISNNETPADEDAAVEETPAAPAPETA